MHEVRSTEPLTASYLTACIYHLLAYVATEAAYYY